MVKKFRKAVYASRSERAKLYERVTMLCERKRKPSPAEVKAVLPQKLYREYLKRLRTFRVQKAAERRPDVIDRFIKERNRIRSKITSIRASSRYSPGSGKIRHAEAEWATLVGQFVELLSEKPILKAWILPHYDEGDFVDPDGDPVRFHTLASFNKAVKEQYCDSAEREALMAYQAVLAKEFDDSDDVSAVAPSRKFRDFSGIKF